MTGCFEYRVATAQFVVWLFELTRSDPTTYIFICRVILPAHIILYNPIRTVTRGCKQKQHTVGLENALTLRTLGFGIADT